MNIHQFLTSYSYGDAIGNETLEIRNFLRSQGYRSEIFALSYHPRYADHVINYREYDRYSDPGNIAIFHFSIGSPVTEKFLKAPDRKVIIYHNITPYEFFMDFHRGLALDCYNGRAELKNFVGKVDLALGDSEYNETGFSNTGVLPLAMNFQKFDIGTAPVLKELFDDGKTNILFAGRLAPHKKIEDVIRVFHLYQTYFNPGSRLFIVGDYREFERYLFVLQNMVARMKIKNVHFTGHIPDDELVSYYKLSHLYLHLSEHEGFCAPILESYYLDIPVVAFNAGAVRETMNNGGILVNRKDFLRLAAAIDHILTNTPLKTAIIRSQRESLAKYFPGSTGKVLMDYLSKLRSAVYEA